MNYDPFCISWIKGSRTFHLHFGTFMATWGNVQGLMWHVVLRMRGEMNGGVIRGNCLWSPEHCNLLQGNCMLSEYLQKKANVRSKRLTEGWHYGLNSCWEDILFLGLVSFDDIWLLLSDKKNAYIELHVQDFLLWNMKHGCVSTKEAKRKTHRFLKSHFEAQCGGSVNQSVHVVFSL